MYANKTTLAVTAAVTPASVELPMHGLGICHSKRKEVPTAEDGVHSQEIHANRSYNHGCCETEELVDYIPRYQDNETEYFTLDWCYLTQGQLGPRRSCLAAQASPQHRRRTGCVGGGRTWRKNSCLNGESVPE
jgi:hypothetical protein